jgi:hypothetical protein
MFAPTGGRALRQAARRSGNLLAATRTALPRMALDTELRYKILVEYLTRFCGF